MSHVEIELEILRRFVEHHKAATIKDPSEFNKCDRELDMREVVASIGVYPEEELRYHSTFWFERLAPSHGRSGPLHRCSNSRISGDVHSFHARAFINGSDAPAWDRITDLEGRVPQRASRELEQKFRILCSRGQADVDFMEWTKEAANVKDYSIGCLFVDLDNFKRLNTAFTNETVDTDILKPFQVLLRELSLHRGVAYRHGGEEFIILLPNQTASESNAFAERVRGTVDLHRFSVSGNQVHQTVSIGVACYPNDGTTLGEIVGQANRLEIQAKANEKNVVCGASE
jgi:diguanylate cyclase (GGDEF)-like protein